MKYRIYQADIDNLEYDTYGCSLTDVYMASIKKDPFVTIVYRINNPNNNIRESLFNGGQIKTSSEIMLNLEMSKNCGVMLAKKIMYQDIISAFKSIMEMFPDTYKKIIGAVPTEFFLDNEIMKSIYESLPNNKNGGIYANRAMESEIKKIIDDKFRLMNEYRKYGATSNTAVNLLNYVDEKKKNFNNHTM